MKQSSKKSNVAFADEETAETGNEAVSRAQVRAIERIKISVIGAHKTIRVEDETEGDESLLQTALSLLKIGKFSPAETMFSECLAENSDDGLAMLGLFCAQRKDADLFEQLTGTKKRSFGSSEKEKISRIAELENIILNISDPYIIQNILLYIKHNGIGDVNWAEFNEERFEKLLASCPDEAKQIEFLDQYVQACLFDAEVRFSVAVREVFEQLIRYYPESKEDAVFEYINSFAERLLENSRFGAALDLVGYSLSHKGIHQINARFIILLAALKCKNRDELLRCHAFDDNIKEYKELLVACRHNSSKLKEYASLTEDKLTAAKQDKDKKVAKVKKTAKTTAVISAIVLAVAFCAFCALSTYLWLRDGSMLWSIFSLASLMAALIAMTAFFAMKTRALVEKTNSHINKWGILTNIFVYVNILIPAAFSLLNFFIGGSLTVGLISLAVFVVVLITELILLKLESVLDILYSDETLDAFHYLLSAVLLAVSVISFFAGTSLISEFVAFFALVAALVIATVYALTNPPDNDLFARFIVTLDFALPTAFAFLNWFMGGNIIFGIINFVIAIAASIVLMVLTWEDIGSLLMSVPAALIASIAMIDFSNGGAYGWGIAASLVFLGIIIFTYSEIFLSYICDCPHFASIIPTALSTVTFIGMIIVVYQNFGEASGWGLPLAAALVSGVGMLISVIGGFVEDLA